jgi:large subunit ribosomal protein L4
MNTTIPVLKIDGSDAGSLPVDPAWIELERGTQAVHDDVVAFLAKMRSGSAATKTRGKVSGGGAKPWRQKGTGRARAGSNRSPVWRGGGIVFGPTPRSYAKQINRKVRQLALKRAFSERMNEGAVIVLDQLALDEPKTRKMAALLAAVGAGDDVLIVASEPDANVLLAARNLPGVEIMKPGVVNTYWMLLFKKILFTQEAMKSFTARFAAAGKEKEQS